MIVKQVEISCDFLEKLEPDSSICNDIEFHQKFFQWSCIYDIDISFEKLDDNYCQVNLKITEKENG